MKNEILHHGFNAYRRGCRCNVCRKANAERKDWERYDASLSPMEPGDPRHGTLNGYVNRGCRCGDCREANTAKKRAARASK